MPPTFLLWTPQVVLDHYMFSTIDRDQPFHVAIDLSGPHYFSQWEISVFHLASLHCKLNRGCWSLFFLASTIDLHNWYQSFTIWHCSFTHTSMVHEIDWDHRSDSDLISFVECFLTFNPFRNLEKWFWSSMSACKKNFGAIDPPSNQPQPLIMSPINAFSAPATFFFTLHLW